MIDHWIGFRDKYNLSGREISIPISKDLSGAGAEIEILDNAGMLNEQTALYPGIRVSRDGYVPVGGCALGSGDPYFININEGEGGPLYRIYHDEVSDEGTYDRNTAIATVLKDYRELHLYM